MSNSSQSRFRHWGMLAFAAFVLFLGALAGRDALSGEKTSGKTSFGSAVMPSSSEQTLDGTLTSPALNPAYAAQIATMRSADIPKLPFADNPDPSQCGIPVIWGEDGRAWLTGIYQGKLAEPMVFLYDSHLRLNIVAKAPHGTEVEVILYQQNPVTDYYLVKIKGAEQPNEGWIPGPFLSFDPLSVAGFDNQP
jgi:hypothetical protein